MSAAAALVASVPPCVPHLSTDAFYQTHAEDYATLTRAADLSDTYQHFLPLLPRNAVILDAGCGAGRDLKAFVQRGYLAQGIDASAALCELASVYSGAPCFPLRVEDLRSRQLYNGVWACASLLHLSKAVLPIALRRLQEALVVDGVFFASVQIGEGERVVADGRAYAYYQPEEFGRRVENAGFAITELWESADTLRRAGAPRWLNVVARAI